MPEQGAKETQSSNLLQRAVEELREEIRQRLRQSSEELLHVVEAMTARLTAPEPKETEKETADGSLDIGALRDAMAQIDGADSQAEVLARLVEQTAAYASRVALFLAPSDGSNALRGWAGLGFDNATMAIEGVELPLKPGSPWAMAADGEGSPILSTADVGPLCNQIGAAAPRRAALIPLILRDRVEALLYGDELAAHELSIEALQMLTHSAAQTLETLPLRQRHGSPALAEARAAQAAPADAPALEPPAATVPQTAEAAGLSPVDHATAEPPSLGMPVAELPSLEPTPEPVTEASSWELAPAAALEAPEPPPLIEPPMPPSLADRDIDRATLSTAPVSPDEFRPPAPPTQPTDLLAPEPAPEVPPFELLTTEPSAPELFPPEPPAPPPTAVERPDLFGPPSPPPAAMQVPAAPSTALSEGERAAGFVLEPMPPEAVASVQPELDTSPPPRPVPPPGVELLDAAPHPPLSAAPPSAPPPAPPVPPAAPAAPQGFQLESPGWSGFEPPAPPPAAAPGAFETAGADAFRTVPPPPPAPPAQPPSPPPQALETQLISAIPEPPPAPSEVVPPPHPVGIPGGEVVPPSDIQGPGWAFSGTDHAGPRAGEEPLHDEARRLARLLVSEIKLYNEEVIAEGRRKGNIYQELREDIDRSRQMYEERIDEHVRATTDYFRDELVRSLAAGDATLMGL